MCTDFVLDNVKTFIHPFPSLHQSFIRMIKRGRASLRRADLADHPIGQSTVHLALADFLDCNLFKGHIFYVQDWEDRRCGLIDIIRTIQVSLCHQVPLCTASLTYRQQHGGTVRDSAQYCDIDFYIVNVPSTRRSHYVVNLTEWTSNDYWSKSLESLVSAQSRRVEDCISVIEPNRTEPQEHGWNYYSQPPKREAYVVREEWISQCIRQGRVIGFKEQFGGWEVL